jgi:hypothetical protein
MNLTQKICDLLGELQQQQAGLEQRELQVAKAAEELSQSIAVQQALRCGRQEERGRVVALIDLQLEQLGRVGLNAISLQALRRQLVDGGLDGSG